MIKSRKTFFLVFLLHKPKLGSVFNYNEKVLENLAIAGILAGKQLDFSTRVHNLWDKSDYLFGRGEYWRSLEIKKEIFQEIYNKQGVNNPSHFPPLISSSYTVAIGHIGALHVNKMAEEIGILPKGQRSLLLGEKIANVEAINALSLNTVPASDVNCSSVLTMCPLIENYQIVKSVNGFLDRFELWEKLFEKRKSMDYEQPNPKEDVEATSTAFAHLSSKGIDTNKKIALIHIRNNGNKHEVRNVDVKAYIDSAIMLQKRGFQVVQIGTNEFNRLSTFVPEVFCLSSDDRSTNSLDFYLLTSCSIFIGTTSGPSIFPTLYGVPSVITNLTSISRNSLSGARTIYLPKKLRSLNGDLFSLKDTFASRFSFGGEFLNRQLEREDVRLESNSSAELLFAIEELLERSSDVSIQETNLDSKVLYLRQECNSVSRGLISNSFLKSNYESELLSL